MWRLQTGYEHLQLVGEHSIDVVSTPLGGSLLVAEYLPGGQVGVAVVSHRVRPLEGVHDLYYGLQVFLDEAGLEIVDMQHLEQYVLNWLALQPHLFKYL